MGLGQGMDRVEHALHQGEGRFDASAQGEGGVHG
jgi:hypothetical protein